MGKKKWTDVPPSPIYMNIADDKFQPTAEIDEGNEVCA